MVADLINLAKLRLHKTPCLFRDSQASGDERGASARGEREGRARGASARGERDGREIGGRREILGGVRRALPSFACAKNGVKLTARYAGSIKYLPPVI